MQIDLNNLSLTQLKKIDDSFEALLFKQSGGENFETSFYDDKKEFDKLIRLMVASKRDVMGYFKQQYENRYNLVNRSVVRLDEYDDYLYSVQWDADQKALSLLLENHISQGYDLGIAALALSLGLVFNYSYQDAQKAISVKAEKAAADITTVTQNRVKAQIEAAMKNNEDRAAFDARMKRVFMNPYRGRFIAQHEALNSYMDGKEGLAEELNLGYKTAESSQAKDKICGMVNGETQPRNKPFSNGKMKPLFHFGCKCNIKYHDKNPQNTRN